MKTRQLSSIPWPTGKQKQRKPKLPWLNREKKIPQDKRPDTNKQPGNPRAAIGARSEMAALEYLKSKGLTHISSNFRCKRGELDLIMCSGSTAIIVEVRDRAKTRYADAKASVGRIKQNRINRCSLVWWSTTGQHQYAHLRFDVVALQEGVITEWIQAAWDLSE